MKIQILIEQLAVICCLLRHAMGKALDQGTADPVSTHTIKTDI